MCLQSCLREAIVSNSGVGKDVQSVLVLQLWFVDRHVESSVVPLPLCPPPPLDGRGLFASVPE